MQLKHKTIASVPPVYSSILKTVFSKKCRFRMCQSHAHLISFAFLSCAFIPSLLSNFKKISFSAHKKKVSHLKASNSIFQTLSPFSNASLFMDSTKLGSPVILCFYRKLNALSSFFFCLLKARLIPFFAAGERFEHFIF